MRCFDELMNETKLFFESLPWENKEFYADYLAQSYFYVSHSTRLLARSMSYFQTDRDDLFSRFAKHISEENKHERVATSDLKSLGLSIEQFKEHGITNAFYSSQYYNVDQTKGIGLLGYILYLEGICVYSFSDVMKRLESTYGHKSTKFLRLHTEEDPDHLKSAFAEIEKISKEEQAHIWKNFENTKELYCNILKTIDHRITPTNFKAA